MCALSTLKTLKTPIQFDQLDLLPIINLYPIACVCSLSAINFWFLFLLTSVCTLTAACEALSDKIKIFEEGARVKTSDLVGRPAQQCSILMFKPVN